MGPIWKPQSIEVLKSWVNAILDEASDSLNDWESRFINDMQDRLNRGHTLTQGQEEKLEEIYTEKTS